MKKITLLFVLNLLFTMASYGQLFKVPACTVTLGTNVYGPMSSVATANATSRTAVVYASSQLTGIAGQTLTSIYFNRLTATGAMSAGGSYKIYLKEMTAIDFGASDLNWSTEIATATLVYNSDPSSITGTSAGWKSFPFATNFLYSGAQNLAVYMEYTNPTASAAITWIYDYTDPCVVTANNNTTKYNNNTTGIQAATLSSSNYRRPYVGFDYLVSCNAPNTLTSSNITTTTATANWVENATQPQNGYEYYYSTTNTAPTPTATPNGTTANGIATVNLTGLTSGTPYFFWVRGNCGTSDKSTWTGPLSFTTACPTVTEFVQNFEGLPTGTGNLPACWSKAGTSANVYNTTGSVAPMSPANRLYMNITATTTAYAILPSVSNLQAATHRLKFKGYASAANKKVRVGYFTNSSDLNTFTLIQEIDLPSTTAATALEFAVYPASIPAGVTDLVLNLPDGTATTAYFDDFKWELSPSCPDTTGLVVGGITSSGANVSWDGLTGVTGYEYAVTTSATPPTTGTATTDTFAIITGLMPQTVYYLHVRSACSGNTFGIWSTSPSFTTACGLVTEFTQNFEGLPTGTGNLPACWSKAGTSANVYNTTGSVAPMSPANRLYMNITATTTAFAILPSVSNLQAATHRLKFKGYASAANKKVRVGYFTNSSDLNTFTLIQEIDLPSTTAATAIEFAIYPTSIPAGVTNLVLNLPDGTATTAYFDDFKWELSPSCPDTTGLVVGGITSSGANVSWDGLTGVTGYEYVVTTSATPPTAGTATTDTFAIITGLLPQTVYYLHVRSACSGNTFGIWTTSTSFTTACGIVTNFTENFDTSPTGTGNLPVCWSKAGTSANVYTTTGSVVPMSPANRLYMNITTTTTAYAISPSVSNLSAATHRLKFKAYATTANKKVRVGYFTNIADLNTFTLIQEIDLPSTTAATALEFVVYPPSIPAGVTNLVLNLPEGTATTAYFDDFKWELSPACPDQTGLVVSGVTYTGANVSWDGLTGVTGYEYAVTTSATPPTTGTATTDTFAVISSLSPQTTYYLHVRSACSGSTFGLWSTISFFTGYCTPSSTSNASYIDNFATTGGSQNISNLATGFTTGGYLNASSQFVEGFPTSSFNFNAAIVGPTVGFAIWVDWNNDLIFDNATEKVYNTTAYGNGPFTGTVTIPAGTAIGNYRMRIVTDYNATNPSEPCALRPRAEYEDYTISVVAPPACVPPVPSASNIADTTATLTWPAVASAASGYEYVINTISTDPTGIGTATTALTFAATGLTQSTTYYFHIRSVCSAGTYSTWSTVSFTTLATPPVNDNCSGASVLTIDDTYCNGTNNNGTNAGSTNSGVANPACFNYGLNDVWFSVAVPANVATINVSTDFTGGTLVDTEIELYSGVCGTLVQVACDQDSGTTILSNGSSYNSLITNAAVTGGQTYYVRVAGYTATAVGTFCLRVSTNTLGTDNFNNKSFTVYPNPVKDVLNIEYKENITKVQVINLLGQEVITKSVNATQNQIDMSSLAAGTYLVKVTSDDLVKTIKIIKE